MLNVVLKGLVGCMRFIYINGEFIEPRYVVRTKHAVGDVSLDNCQLVDPCKRPDACEHGGKCSVDVDRVVCDCLGTGYIGKNCHFGNNLKKKKFTSIKKFRTSEPDDK